MRSDPPPASSSSNSTHHHEVLTIPKPQIPPLQVSPLHISPLQRLVQAEPHTPYPPDACEPASPPSTSRRSFLQTGAITAAALALAPRIPPALAQTSSASPLVTTDLGTFRGQTLAEGIRAFRGIPFAQPPIGPLRFLPPVAFQAGIQAATRDALSFGPPAMQPDQPDAAEDCLYLNVWAPPSGGPHPVFVWIHGGGYTGGRASEPVFEGSGFAREGIVLVTVAYRLGVFGFMDLSPLLGPAYADSANNALRDLVLALRWVNSNISAFGGDPKCVTVGGESAGAKATAALMALPEAQSLFHSAISESGGGERVLTSPQAHDVASSFGELWRRDHPASSGAAGFDDLRTAPAHALIQTQQTLIAASAIHFPFRPQIANQAGASLLPKRPVDLVAEGSARGKRLLLGTNRDESALFLGPHPAADPTASDLGNLALSRFNEVFARYAALYPDMPRPQLRVRAVTAEEYWVPSVRLADAHVRAGGSAWMYRLDFAPSTGRMAGEAFHAEDIDFVWNKLNKSEAGDPTAAPLAASIHAAWCAFIRGETPAATGLPAWPEYNPNTRPTMILNTSSHVEQRPFDAELRLWDGVL